MFLSARALRRLAALPPEARLAALATLDPAMPAARRQRRRQIPNQGSSDEPGAA